MIKLTKITIEHTPFFNYINLYTELPDAINKDKKLVLTFSVWDIDSNDYIKTNFPNVPIEIL